MKPTLTDEFQRNGFIKIPGFLGNDELQALLDFVHRFILDAVQHLPREDVFFEEIDNPNSLKQIQRLFAHDPQFSKMLFGSRFEDLARTLLGNDVQGVNLQYFNKPPGIGKPTPAHQDGYYFMLEPQEAVTMWLALDDVDMENGCVRYIPQSHLNGLLPHRPTQTLGFSQGLANYPPTKALPETAIPAQPGDLLVHHALTVHRADANQSADRQRQSLGLVYYSVHAVESPQKALRQAELMSHWKSSGRI
ncbi:MAG: phytanoyl-CoA dioxygenase family protein [Pirellulaceae bacterium]|nr:phytanoyl-CoA dioxygenase family protein [Pirellulaceae bacterium]